jgi:RHS repeat-associated protein
MTLQESPVSGVTTYAYNEHGEQVTEIDARGVVVTRAMDVLDRVTAVSYPDPSLTTTYAYDAGTFDTYAYPTNPSGGSSPKLHSITFGAGGTHTFSYDAAGNTTQVYKSDEVLQLIYDGASRLSTLRSIPEDARTHFAYDGRSFLRRAEGNVDECHPGLTVPTYDSAGLLRRREHRKLFTPAAPPQDSETVLYFAGRPVATLRLTPSTSDLNFLTTDHLGTPILATADTGALVWQGGFEPFGADWNGAVAAGVFLRFPGQWVDGLWEGGRLSSELYYNVHRWYGWGTGRYGRVDPLIQEGDLDLDVYVYAANSPVRLTDPLGLVPCDSSDINACRIACRRKGTPYLGCKAFDLPIPCTAKKIRFIKCECNETCIPCPPGGPFPNVRIDKVPPSAPHYPCPGDHWHYRRYNQNPKSCRCYPSPWKLGGCL